MIMIKIVCVLSLIVSSMAWGHVTSLSSGDHPCEALSCAPDETAVPYHRKVMQDFKAHYKLACKCIQHGVHLLPNCPSTCVQGASCCEKQEQQLCALNGKGNTCNCNGRNTATGIEYPGPCKIDRRTFHFADLFVNGKHYYPALDHDGRYEQSDAMRSGLIAPHAPLSGGTAEGALLYKPGKAVAIASTLNEDELEKRQATIQRGVDALQHNTGRRLQGGIPVELVWPEIFGADVEVEVEVAAGVSAGGMVAAVAIGAVVVGAAVGGIAALVNAQKRSWEEQGGCAEWCRQQADSIPWLKQLKVNGETTRLPAHKYRQTPYNWVDRGVVIGKRPFCNHDIDDEEYCKVGCSVDGVQMPCTVVHQDPSSAWDKGFMFDGQGNTGTNTPTIKDETTALGSGCTSGSRYCCCVDPEALDHLSKTPEWNAGDESRH